MLHFIALLTSVPVAFVLMGLWHAAAMLFGVPAPDENQITGVLIACLAMSQVLATALVVFLVAAG